jgi:hypothetical protein
LSDPDGASESDCDECTGGTSEVENMRRHAREDAEGVCVFVERIGLILSGAAAGTTVRGAFTTDGRGF